MNNSIELKALAAASLLVFSLPATTCIIVEGAGKGTQNLGKDIQQSAQQNK